MSSKDIYIHPDVEFKITPELKDHIAIDKGVYCTVRSKIGSYVHISPYVTIIGVKNAEFIAEGINNIMAGARIICGSDRFDDTGLFGACIPKDLKGTQIIGTIVLKKFSNVGTNAILLPNTILNEGTLIAAGSLFYGESEPWTVYKGNPAKPVKKIDKSSSLKNFNILKEKYGYY